MLSALEAWRWCRWNREMAACRKVQGQCRLTGINKQPKAIGNLCSNYIGLRFTGTHSKQGVSAEGFDFVKPKCRHAVLHLILPTHIRVVSAQEQPNSFRLECCATRCSLLRSESNVHPLSTKKHPIQKSPTQRVRLSCMARPARFERATA